jgi:pimeloyl-ACP methyl ester carboxylesterase
MYHSTGGEMMKLGKGKITVLLIPAIGLVMISVLIGGSWYVSSRIRDGLLVPKNGVQLLDLEVVDLTENHITLGVTPLTQKNHWKKEGIWGLRWNGGYAQVGQILYQNEHKVDRLFFPQTGNLKRGDMVRLDVYAFPDDPQKAFGLQTQDVVFTSPLGNYSAWFIEGRSNKWVIFLHGKRDHPPQQPLHAFPILPVVAKLEFPSLVITYCNDLGEPESPDGFHRYGQYEWKDLEGAVKYAVEQGAKEFILVGYSMGGAIVMNFLYRSPLADKVRGVILDSPMLNLSATTDFGGRLVGLPQFLISLGKLTAGIRFKIDWKALDNLRRANELTAPILLFHGDADRTIPVETSDALAKARADIVSYHRVPGATHIRSWNMNPSKYEDAVRDFLRRVLSTKR